MPAKILIVEDERITAEDLRDILTDLGYFVTRIVSSGAEAIAEVEQNRPDLVLMDINIHGDMDGTEVARAILAGYDVPSIILSAHADVHTLRRARAAQPLGYLTKPFRDFELRTVIEAALARRKAETAAVADDGAGKADPRDAEIAAVSEEMSSVVRFVCCIAQNEVRIALIEGEPGAGKKHLARFLHSCRRHPNAPFVVVHGGAPHEVEAGSSATSWWETKAGGTIFLEDVEKMPPRQQNELLRRIEDNSLRDACVVAAPCRGLDQAVGPGVFRLELYYRLNAISVRIPPLRDRRQDILPLAACFIQRQNECLQSDVRGLSDPAAALLLAHHWPGNVDELRSVIERAMRFERAPWIDPAALCLDIPWNAARTDAMSAS